MGDTSLNDKREQNAYVSFHTNGLDPWNAGTPEDPQNPHLTPGWATHRVIQAPQQPFSPPAAQAPPIAVLDPPGNVTQEDIHYFFERSRVDPA